MARTQDQSKWRRHSSRRRIEVSLPVDQGERFDALAVEHGVTRTAMLGQLIDKATVTQSPAAKSTSASETAPSRRHADGSTAPSAGHVQKPVSPGEEPSPTPDQTPRHERSTLIKGLAYQKTAAGRYAVYLDGTCVGRAWRNSHRWCAVAGCCNALISRACHRTLPQACGLCVSLRVTARREELCRCPCHDARDESGP